MRSFQLLFIIIFLTIYFLISLGAFFNVKRIAGRKRPFRIIYFSYSIFLILFFVFLYIYPNTPREAHNYLLYFYFNAVLFIDFSIKIILALFYIASLLIKQKRVISFAAIILALGFGSILLYGLLFGKNQLKVTKQELFFPRLPSAFDGYKIVQISDLHLGSINKSSNLIPRVEKVITELHPDLILFTGDLVNNFSDETEGWSDIFRKMNVGETSFSILGNHDYGNYATWKNDSTKEENFEEIVASDSILGFQLLRNESHVIHKENDSIFVVGVENWGLPPFPQYANLDKAEKGIPQNAFKILMTHDPAHWETVVKYENKYDLTLSGHTHGMQWGFKFAGIPLSPAYFTRETWGGLYQYNNSLLYVNTGLGTVGIPWRIDMPAEITVFTLRTKID